MLTAIGRQKILAIMLYITSTVGMIYLFQNQIHHIARLANVDFARSQVWDGNGEAREAVSFFPTKKFETAPAPFGLTQEQVGGNPSEPVKVFLAPSDLCDGSNMNDYYDYSDPTTHLNLLKDSDKKIAILVKRGNCSFEEKARNTVKAYQTQSDQVKYLIIYDDHQSHDKNPPKISMEIGTGFGPDIPLMLLFVSPDTAEAIIQVLSESVARDKHTKPFVLITIDAGTLLGSSSKKHLSVSALYSGSLDTKMKLFAIQVIASILVTILSFLFTASVLLYWYRDSITVEISRSGIMFSHLDASDDPVDPKKLFTEEQVMEFAVAEYGTRCHECKPGASEPLKDLKSKKSKALHCNSTCSICLEDFELKEELRVLPCGHLFHTECIVPWLTTRAANCPLCKEEFVITPKEEETMSGLQSLLNNPYLCSPLRCRQRRRSDTEGSDIESGDEDDNDSTISQSFSLGDVETGTPRRRAIQANNATSFDASD